MNLPILQVSRRLFRSPQPDFEDFLALNGLGISAVVNLREEATESAFFCRQAKLAYLHIPVVDWTTPTTEQVEQFLHFVEDTDATLVHCAAGVGRTGTFVACYRIWKGMGVEEALHLTNEETPIRNVFMNKQQQDFVREFSQNLL